MGPDQFGAVVLHFEDLEAEVGDLVEEAVVFGGVLVEAGGGGEDFGGVALVGLDEGGFFFLVVDVFDVVVLLALGGVVGGLGIFLRVVIGVFLEWLFDIAAVAAAPAPAAAAFVSMIAMFSRARGTFSGARA